MKHCTTCGQDKEVSCFNNNKTKPDGKQTRCRDCDKANGRGRKYKESAKQYQEKNKEALQQRSREFHYKAKYGLTLTELDEMREQQGFSCFICGVHEDHTQREVLCVDHDHDTGQVRKLLCATCNQGLGLFKDSSSLLFKAAQYLEAYGKP